MADYQRGFAYCSPFPPVLSLDALLEAPASPVFRLVDTDDDPETALLRSGDGAAIRRWVAALPDSLRRLAEALMRGEAQVEVARREGVTEAAISKRMVKLRQRGVIDLFSLRQSPLLQ